MNDESMSILNNTKHQVTFLAPVGTKNWTPSMTEQLSKLLPPLVRVVLVPSSDHITPIINIWHDERENVRWLPVDGSFESIGADGLWQNRPSSQDILSAIQGCKENEDIILHAIVESGKKPTGQGMDSLPEPTEDEEDYLDKAWGLDPDSRLSCQAVVGDGDLVVEIPKYTINLVSENH